MFTVRPFILLLDREARGLDKECAIKREKDKDVGREIKEINERGGER